MKQQMENVFKVHVDASEADDVLRQIARSASEVIRDRSFEEIYDSLQRREQLTSTGIGHGVALPHCFFDGLTEFVTGLITTTNAVEFAAADGTSVDLFFFIVAPSQQRSEHVALLSRISRLVRSDGVREKLRAAENEQTLKSLCTPVFQVPPDSDETEWTELQVVVPMRYELELILEELTARANGNVFVQELKKSTSYLTRMPLFASLWTSDVDESIRLVTTVLDKRLVNETVRSLQAVLSDEGEHSNVLITARDLLYVSGHVEL